MLNVNLKFAVAKEMGRVKGGKHFDRDRTRTCNPQIRSLMPYPLGHTAAVGKKAIFADPIIGGSKNALNLHFVNVFN